MGSQKPPKPLPKLIKMKFSHHLNLQRENGLETRGGGKVGVPLNYSPKAPTLRRIKHAPRALGHGGGLTQRRTAFNSASLTKWFGFNSARFFPRRES